MNKFTMPAIMFTMLACTMTAQLPSPAAENPSTALVYTNRVEVPHCLTNVPLAVNVRFGPSTAYAVKQTLPDGVPVELLDTVGKWAHVRLNQFTTGYIHSYYLKCP